MFYEYQGNYEPWRIGGFVMLCGYLPLTLLCALLFFKRRSRFPISGRFPYHSLAALMISLPSFFIYGYSLIVGWWNVSCFTIFTLSLTLVTTLTISQLRRVMLLTQFMLTDLILTAEQKRQEYRQQQQQGNANAEKGGGARPRTAFSFFDEKQYRLLSWRLVNIPRIYFVWHLALFIVYVALTAPFAEIGTTCTASNKPYW